MIKILGKIDLPSPERKKNAFEKRSSQEIIERLDVGMKQSVERINERIAKHGYEGAPLISEAGDIDMDAFEGIAYSGGDIEFDREQVIEQKRGFYNTYNPLVQEKYGTTDEIAIIHAKEKEERMRDGRISEEVLFVTLAKMLGDRYVPMRSSEHDDFLHGTDLLLIDTHTGKPICAFDKTVESAVSRKAQKIERAKKQLLKGRGMRMKYGVTINREGVKLGALDNIPPLFLAISKADLDLLKHTSDFDIDGPITKQERQVMNNLMASVGHDIRVLESSSRGSVSYDAVHDMIASLKERLA